MDDHKMVLVLTVLGLLSLAGFVGLALVVAHFVVKFW